MTYDIFLKTYCKKTNSNAYDDVFFENDLKATWNAAIEAASKAVEWVDFNEDGRYPHEIINNLKVK